MIGGTAVGDAWQVVVGVAGMMTDGRLPAAFREAAAYKSMQAYHPALLQRAGAAAQFVEDLTLLEASTGSTQGRCRRSRVGTPDLPPAVVSGQAGDVAAFGRLVVQVYQQRVLLEAPDNSRCAPTCIPLVQRSRVHCQPLSGSCLGVTGSLLCPCDLQTCMAYCNVLADAFWPPDAPVLLCQCPLAVYCVAQQREHGLPA